MEDQGFHLPARDAGIAAVVRGEIYDEVGSTEVAKQPARTVTFAHEQLGLVWSFTLPEVDN